MPEIRKRIVIASVLKPLNDPRMTEKIASTLADNPMHEVHVIGFPGAIPADARTTFHTFPAFKRLSVARWFAPARILRMIVRINPSIIIVTTHELLLAGVLAKMLLPTKLVYDVQENYFLNIRHTNAFPVFLRIPVAEYVRFKEWVASVFIDHYFIAEKVYAIQLRFLKNNFTILQNKTRRLALPVHPRAARQLVFSGTLSRSTGVFRAIELAKKLHADDPFITLTIIGYASHEGERTALRNAVKNVSFIRLVGGHHLVPHEEIMTLISEAGAGIIAYELNPATQRRVPTKLYEYLGAGLPVIFVESEAEWRELASFSGVDFISISSSEYEISTLLTWLYSPLHRGTFPNALYWKSEENKLQNAITAL
jgi:glycosyltransferase involved in cell wall biosynthesis